jgi:hypothetical protein
MKQNTKQIVTMTSTSNEIALPDPPTDGITRVVFAPDDANRLLVSSWEAVRATRVRTGNQPFNRLIIIIFIIIIIIITTTISS